MAQVSGTFPQLNSRQRAKLAIRRRDDKALTAPTVAPPPARPVGGGLRAHRQMARALARRGRHGR